jgi:vacuolar-type H+-ATPase subunit H
MDIQHLLDRLEAQRVNQERDRIIAQAKEEAGRIIELARQEAAKLTEEHTLAQQAEELALTIEERARREADSVRRDADEYVVEVLTQLETDLIRTLTVVRNGIGKLRMDQQYYDASELEPADSAVSDR